MGGYLHFDLTHDEGAVFVQKIHIEIGAVRILAVDLVGIDVGRGQGVHFQLPDLFVQHGHVGAALVQPDGAPEILHGFVGAEHGDRGAGKG